MYALAVPPSYRSQVKRAYEAHERQARGTLRRLEAARLSPMAQARGPQPNALVENILFLVLANITIGGTLHFEDGTKYNVRTVLQAPIRPVAHVPRRRRVEQTYV